MSQVVRTTNQLINNALYLTGELGVGETPDAFMLSTGLELINELLDKFSSDSIYIPFLKTIEFTMVTGQDTYTVSDMVSANIASDRIVDLSFANYFIQEVVYPIRIIDKATYYGVVRIGNPTLVGRPGFVFLNKMDTSSEIIFYPAPDQPYECTLQVKQMIDKLDPQEDLSELPPYYYGFLKYALARKFIAYYPSANWPQQNEDEYWDYYNNLKNANETDLTVKPSAIITRGQLPFYWQNILAF